MKILVAVLVGLLAVPTLAALQATADMSYTQLNASTYRYSINLHNTGDTTVGTLWYSWIPGYDFMPASPTNVQTPADWYGYVVGGYPGDGYSIEWYALSGLVSPGQSLAGFQFDSTVSPAQMTALAPTLPLYHVNHAFVYVGFPEYDPGFQFDVTLVPEPATLALVALSVALCANRARPPNAV
jgi:hypothetical protein